MKDYRQPDHRLEYFAALYNLNLEQKIMPGLVYLYLPELARRYAWDEEQKLWFAFLNGMTQNPITSLRLFDQLDHVPTKDSEVSAFEDWFNKNWNTLQFDSDRLKNKRNTVSGLKSYIRLVNDHGGYQSALWDTGQSYQDCWTKAISIHGFGRLSSFSFLEYVKIMGFGSPCMDLMFDDFDGSRSHRNGALFLQGMDHLVYDKRAQNGFDGKYDNFQAMCDWLSTKSNQFLKGFTEQHQNTPDVGYFTLESCYCQFKNGFFRRRYPGVYSDMAWERIQWADERGLQALTAPFKDIREEHLPDWLRIETESKPIHRTKRAAQFAETGTPFRADRFLLGNN